MPCGDTERVFRPSEISDDIEIAQLWRSAWMSANPTVAQVEPLAHWLARVRNEFRDLQVTLLLLNEDRLAAFMAVDPEARYLHQLFVAPDFQGQGIGARMIQQVCALCPEGWSLHVAESNVRARDFYARNHLQQGDEDVNPITGRVRVSYTWRAPRA